MANNPENINKQNKDDPRDDDDITFYFFYNIVKKMILNRRDVGDVCTLSSWLKSLEDNKNKSVRNEYIKLMLLLLKYPKLVCPFKDAPPETIDPLENGVLEMSRKFLNNEGTANCPGGIDYDEPDPSISVAVSNDKRQYASSQVIPNVGVQCYFAYSDDHIYNWNIPPQVNVPHGGPHATHVDWERYMAGIISETYTPSTENLEPRNAKNDEATSNSISGSAFSKRRSARSRLRINEDPNVCQVMHIEQQNRNINEDFVWNDSSMLTGEIILGAEMCSDRKVDAQVKSQVELDEEVMSSYDKLYPGDFKTYVDSSVVQEIIFAKNIAMDSGDKQIQQNTTRDEKSMKKRTDYDCGLKTQHNNNRGKMFIDSKNYSNSNRQYAGQETEIVHQCDPIKKINNNQQYSSNNVFELSPEMANTKNLKNRNYVERKYSKTNDDSSTDDLEHFKRPVNSRERLIQRDTSTTVLERGMMVYKQQINMADKYAKLIVQNFDQESKSIDTNPNYHDLDTPSDT